MRVVAKRAHVCSITGQPIGKTRETSENHGFGAHLTQERTTNPTSQFGTDRPFYSSPNTAKSYGWRCQKLSTDRRFQQPHVWKYLTCVRSTGPYFHHLPQNWTGAINRSRISIMGRNRGGRSGTLPSQLASTRSDRCVDDMAKQGLVEQRPSPWRSPVTIVVSADGTPRFCVYYRSTIDKHMVRQTWSMRNLEASLETKSGPRYFTVCDIQNAYHQISAAESEIEKAAFVTKKGTTC